MRDQPFVLAAPPPLGDAPQGGIPLQSLLPVVGSLSSITMMVVLRGNPLMVVIGAMILVLALTGGIGMALSSRGRQVRTRRQARERYLDYLEGVRSELRTRRDTIRRGAHRVDPAPAGLTSVVQNPSRVWERRPNDADFLRVRVGTGTLPWFGLSVPEDPNPVAPQDPNMVQEAQTVTEHFTSIAGMPALVSLSGAHVISVVGDPEHTREFARGLIAQVASFHSPNDVQLAFSVDDEARFAWEGIDLLPHVVMPERWDGPVQARRIGRDPNELIALMRDELAKRESRARARRGTDGGRETPLIAVLDRAGAAAHALVGGAGGLGIITIALVDDRLDEPTDTTLRFTVGDDRSILIERAGAASARATAEAFDAVNVRVDPTPVPVFAAVAGHLAPIRLNAASRNDAGTQRFIGALELLGVDDAAAISPNRWRSPRTREDFLRVPVGVDDHGAMVNLDIKESAHGGMGPHGICIGATGSGKSEFLRTLVLGLATSHSPDDISMILVDYKGGAAFNPFQALPQVAGLIDNLEGESGLIERARASISGEVVRRQQQLKDAGSLASISEYRAARSTNPSLTPMPHLFLVIDEFGELLTAEPDFINLLLTIGRIGRSIGVHMLLSSQRIEGGRLKGLDTYLSYRIGLRTFSEQESQVVLNTPDAFHLPPVPGYGFLKVDTTVYTRFVSGYVSGPIPGPTASADDEEPIGAFELPAGNTVEASLAAARGEAAPTVRRDGPALIDFAVEKVRAGVHATAPVWLPPLPDRFPLFQILGEPVEPLQVPIGIIDNPTKQQQGPWRIDLARAGGHHAVIGAPQSGRSTFLRTLAAGIATTHTPTHVTMYGLDLTGAGLTRLEAFPHVGGIATRSSPEQQTRLIEELQGMLVTRERLFREHRIESLAHLRARHASGALKELVSPDVVLLIDGYGLVRSDFEHLDAPLADLLTRGSSFGIHLVLALTRWAEVQMKLQPLIGNRYELRLNDSSESTIARKLSATLVQPGRSLTDDQLFAHVAMPTIDDVPDEQTGEALADLAAQTAASWNGPSAAAIRLLPDNLDPTTLPDEFDEPDRVPLGLRQDTMEPALLDLGGRDQHLLVLGDTESGKTTLLRQVIAGLTARRTPDEVVFALMEPRGILAGEVPDEYLGGHASNGMKSKELAGALALELVKRQEGGSTNLHIVAVVDDYDILSAGNTGPLEPLLPFLPQARDLGLSVVLTRPVAGASRALYESVLQTLKDIGATGVVLAGERSEGPIWPGVYATPTIPGRGRVIRRGEPPRLIQVANRTG